MSAFNRYVVAINGSGGASVILLAKGSCRHCTIVECPPNGGAFTGSNFSPTGINYQLPVKKSDGTYVFTGDTFGLNPGTPLQIGNPIPEGAGRGPLVGAGPQQDPGGKTIAAVPFASMKSATVTGTQVEVTEYF